MIKTVFFIDWDDTLLSTTYIERNNIIGKLNKLEESIEQLLKKILQFGDVYIITNATIDWFNDSINEHVPKITQLIKSKVIHVISARDLYEYNNPQLYMVWKYYVMSDILKKYTGYTVNLLALGDMDTDKESAINAVLEYPNTILKLVKLIERPTLKQLLKQHKLIQQCLEFYINYDNIITIDFSQTYSYCKSFERSSDGILSNISQPLSDPQSIPKSMSESMSESISDFIGDEIFESIPNFTEEVFE